MCRFRRATRVRPKAGRGDALCPRGIWVGSRTLGAHAPCLLCWLTNEEEQQYTADLEAEAPSVTGLSRQQDADSPLQLYGGKGKTVVMQAEGQHEPTSEV